MSFSAHFPHSELVLLAFKAIWAKRVKAFGLFKISWAFLEILNLMNSLLMAISRNGFR